MAELIGPIDVMALGEQAARTAPPAEWVFDDKLLSADALLKKAGVWAVHVQLDERGTVLVCTACEGMIEPVITTDGAHYPMRLVQTLANTLRHMVMHHDVPLSGRSSADG